MSNTEAKDPFLRILVTGGCGFLGSHLCRRLVNEGHDVIALDNFFTSQKSNVKDLLDKPNFEVIRGDVTKEFFIDFDLRDREQIVDFFFVNEEIKISYDDLLSTICSRDPKKAIALKEASMKLHVDVDKQFMIVDEQRARDFGGTLNLFDTK